MIVFDSTEKVHAPGVECPQTPCICEFVATKGHFLSSDGPKYFALVARTERALKGQLGRISEVMQIQISAEDLQKADAEYYERFRNVPDAHHDS